MRNKVLIKFKEMELDNARIFDINKGCRVTLNGVMFPDGFISKVEIAKRSYVEIEDHLFIDLFMGNVNISTAVSQEDYVVTTEDERCSIRKAEDFDY